LSIIQIFNNSTITINGWWVHLDKI
jgi:hypothetical protein